jgi:hypothetical protein
MRHGGLWGALVMLGLPPLPGVVAFSLWLVLRSLRGRAS